MNRLVVVIAVILIVAGIGAGIFFYFSAPAPEQAFRANLTDAQTMLVRLRQAETLYHQTSNSYRSISAERQNGKMIYSEGWRAMNLPEVKVRTGFEDRKSVV